MSAPSSAQMGGAALAAQRLANELRDRLGAIEAILKRQLELSQAPRKNFLGAGTIAGGTTVGTAPATIMGANLNRRGLNVQNLNSAGGANISLGLGTTTPVPGTGLVLGPGQSWDGRVSGMLWVGSVSVISTATSTFSFLEA